MQKAVINGVTILLKVGDITEEDADAVVNAANTTLLGGSGVDGAIHRKGGSAILAECKKIDGCRPGDAVITTGGDLKAQFVIHTVGPIWYGGKDQEDVILRNAYVNSLKRAQEQGLKTVSFPSISTGAYGYPVKKAARVALTAIHDFIKREGCFKEVRMVLFRKEVLQEYEKALEEVIKSGARVT